jgi:hypothetical protein
MLSSSKWNKKSSGCNDLRRGKQRCNCHDQPWPNLVRTEFLRRSIFKKVLDNRINTHRLKSSQTGICVRTRCIPTCIIMNFLQIHHYNVSHYKCILLDFYFRSSINKQSSIYIGIWIFFYFYYSSILKTKTQKSVRDALYKKQKKHWNKKKTKWAKETNVLIKQTQQTYCLSLQINGMFRHLTAH